MTARRFTETEAAMYARDHWKEQGDIRWIHAADYDVAQARIRELEAALTRIADWPADLAWSRIARQALTSGTAPTVKDGGSAEAGHSTAETPVEGK